MALAPHQPEQRAKEAISALRKSGGEHLLLDAAAVASLFSTMTIVVDSTGQHSAAFGGVATVLSTVVKIKRSAAWVVPIIGGVGAVAAAAYLAKQRRLM